jgi:flagellar hook-length control protein FliK
VVRAAAPTLPGAIAEVTARTVAVHMAQSLALGRNRFAIRLDPPDLGRVEVRMEIRHGHLTAQLTVDRPEALDALQRDARGLERALQSAGFDLDDNALSFQLRDQGRGGPNSAPAAPDTADAPDEAETDPNEVQTRRSVRVGGIDITV